MGTTPAYSQTPTTSERIAFAAFRNGQWDIYAIDPEGDSSPWQLTNDRIAESDPAYSPDGARLAFAARRDNNWDVYVLDLLTGQET